MVTIPGVSPDAEIEENANGGKQSRSPYRCDLVPPKAFLRCAAIRKHGMEKYGLANDVHLPSEDNLNHSLAHIFAWLDGDRSDDHPGHVVTRIMMWYEALCRENRIPEFPATEKSDS